MFARTVVLEGAGFIGWCRTFEGISIDISPPENIENLPRVDDFGSVRAAHDG